MPRPLFASLALLAFLGLPSGAEAKIILITHGDTVKHLGDVRTDPQVKLPADKVGFKYSHFGIFWLDLWTWGGEYCLYAEKEYWPIPEELAAALLQPSGATPGKPFFYRVPPGLAIVVFLVALGLIAKVRARRAQKELAAKVMA